MPLQSPGLTGQGLGIRRADSSADRGGEDRLHPAMQPIVLVIGHPAQRIGGVRQVARSVLARSSEARMAEVVLNVGTHGEGQRQPPHGQKSLQNRQRTLRFGAGFPHNEGCPNDECCV